MCHGMANIQTRLSEFTFTFHFHALEKEMATHSSVLAWRIPGTGEPCRLQSMESQSQTRLSDFTFTFCSPFTENYFPFSPLYIIFAVSKFQFKDHLLCLI